MIDTQILIANYNHTPDAIVELRQLKAETLMQSLLAQTTYKNALNHTLTTIYIKRRGGLKSYEVKHGYKLL